MFHKGGRLGRIVPLVGCSKRFENNFEGISSGIESKTDSESGLTVREKTLFREQIFHKGGAGQTFREQSVSHVGAI